MAVLRRTVVRCLPTPLALPVRKNTFWDAKWSVSVGPPRVSALCKQEGWYGGWVVSRL